MDSKESLFRICHMTSVHPLSDLRIFSKECRSLAETGFKVTLIIPRANCTKKKGVKIVDISCSSENRLYRMSVITWKILRAALKEHADVYHFHDPELIPAGLLLRILGNKVIYDVHEDYTLSIKNRYWIPYLIRKPVSWLFEKLENFSAKYFNYIIAATPAIEKIFEPINNNTIIIQNFPLLESLAIKENNTLWKDRLDAVFYFGAIGIHRGIKEMIGAIEQVKSRADLRLILAGKFTPESLKDEIQSMAGWEKVEFLGFISNKKIKTLLNKVKLGFVLYHPLAQHYDAYPTKLFEYMAAGIPVIASDFILWRKIVEGAGSGLVVNPLDPQAIADTIVYLIDHPEQSEEMGRRGIEAVEEKYNWSKEKDKLLQVYKRVLNE